MSSPTKTEKEHSTLDSSTPIVLYHLTSTIENRTEKNACKIQTEFFYFISSLVRKIYMHLYIFK